MRTAALTLSFALATAAAGCGPMQPRPAGKQVLGVGDPAPALAVTRWLDGEPVTGLEPGKVYVLDFWATWCGPCVAAMPHLAELARAHEKDGLVVLPVTTVTGRNTAAAVEAFVQENGPRLGLRFAVCEDRRMEEGWFEAADRGGIPCSFVVDRRGKIAFIGHPLDLDDALPAILAGTGPGDAR